MKFFWVLCLLVLVVYARKHPKHRHSDGEVRKMLAVGGSLEDVDKVKDGLKRMNERSERKMRGKKDKRAERLLKKAKKHEKKNSDLPEDNIVTINERAGFSDYLFEGDIKLTAKQMEEMESSENQREKRMAEYGGDSRKWDISKPIRYTLNASLNALAIETINAAIELYNTKTCIKFEQNDTNYQLIFSPLGGCYSSLGRVSQDESVVQVISIADDGCEWTTTVVHEIAHALNFVHEQSRVDRDNHVVVNTANVPSYFVGQYNKAGQLNSYSQNYDYGSVMHYGPYDFAIDRSIPVMLTIDELYQRTLGSDNYQLLDFTAINDYYGCSTRCEPLDCQHKGVVNPNDCTKCLCADAWTGDRCQTRASGNSVSQLNTGTCGASLTPTTEWQTVRAAVGHWPSEQFRTTQECFWTIETDEQCKKRLELKVTNVFVNVRGTETCFWSGGHIYLNDDPTSNPLTFCYYTDDVIDMVLNSTGTAAIRAYSRRGLAEFDIQYRLAP